MEIFLRNYKRNSFMTGRLRNREKQISDRWVVMIDDEAHLVHILERSDKSLRFECGRKEIEVSSSWHHGDKLFRGVVNGQEAGVRIRENNNTGSYLLQYSGFDAFVTVCSPRIAELSKYLPKVIKNPRPVNLSSPITGKIIRFKVEEGEEVKAGQELVVIEAMKMENIIRTDHDIKIGKIKFAEGETVGIGQVVMDFVE